MIENLVFYNHWQNGDIHVSREFIKFFVNSIQAKNYIYLNHKSPELLKDIPQIQVKKDGLMYLDNDSPFMWNLHTRTLCLNTWYGVSPVFKDTASCTIDTLYHLFNSHLNKIFNTSINPLKLNNFIPTVDYSYFQTEGIKKYLLSNKKKKVLVCNGAVVSKQAKNFSFNDIINSIANDYPSVDFIMTEKFVCNVNNVLFTDDLIAKDGNDLNEISYLSLHCDSIVGRSSGPYIYSMVKENLLNPAKTFICFSDDESIAWWSENRSMFKCKTIWSNDYTSQNIINKIVESIQEQK
tara:strand:+ start:1074 stop:1955 length:882 start_codon:yes stop_codon:yes gene_type:complete